MKWIKKHKVLTTIISLLIIATIPSLFTSRKKIKQLETHTISKGSMKECIFGIGTVTSNKSYDLKTGIAGKVKKIYVKEGDFVEKGDKLIEMETIFTAPFSGTITSISCFEGETILAGTIMKLIDLQDRYISVVMDQKSIMQINMDMPVKLSFDAMRDETFDGKISAMYPSENKFMVRIECLQLPNKILPGMTVDVAVEVKEHVDILLIPINALKNNMVLVKKDNKFELVPVEIGNTDGDMAELVSNNIKEGDEILFEGASNKK